jgi:hypothetical protein
LHGIRAQNQDFSQTENPRPGGKVAEGNQLVEDEKQGPLHEKTN